MSEKEYDLLVFGATSFTGALVVEYLNENYSGLKWAIAARNQEKMDAVKTELECDVPTILLDSTKMKDIEKAIGMTNLILTTVGPYQLYGNDVLAMCAKNGVDYVDLSGEPGWMFEMQKYLAAAKESGARIVHSCGFDSIPSDLGVLMLQKLAKERFGKPVKQVKCRVRTMKGEFSGGTAASLRATLGKLKTNPDFFKVLIDPFCLCEGFKGPEQVRDNKPYYDEITNEWVAPFFMAAINTKNVHRSNTMMGHLYGESFLYDEMFSCGPGEAGQKKAELISAYNPLLGDKVPKPGEGPSKESRDSGSYDMLFTGVDDGEIKINVSVKGEGDPGYSSTSKMIAESALCLLFDCPELAGGIYTTAPAMGQKLLDRLEEKHVMFFAEE
ncbi:saccharopine dehydrogenase NADP-binding domain-containing protein [SAR86 cluster bacterium]|jgi:short subunit dehydrogenase-like uncharacterized protein|nr:saccharopine dehydrogenase NADP-binding domain-containing protein [SAR86 cluster bacterium]